MFYDPVACRPFYQDKEAPIWYGRVENMQAVNQKIYVYGFVTTPLDEQNKRDNELLHLEFSMQMRGKDSDSQYWEYLNPDAEY